jgi:hypothetical protein
MTKDNQGKVKVEKVGLKEITREGFEYEVTINMELDIKHNATVSKDRTGLFMDKPEFVPTEETGKAILAWCETGVEAEKTPLQNALEEIKGAKSIAELTAIKAKYPKDVVDSEAFATAGKAKYDKLQKA